METLGNIDSTLYNYTLEANYPNPFSAKTTIEFELTFSSITILKLFDVLGNEVATLINEEKPAGNYEVEFNANDLSNGI